MCTCVCTEHLLGALRLGNKNIPQPSPFKQLGIHRAHEIEHLGVRSRLNKQCIPSSCSYSRPRHGPPGSSGQASQEERAALLGGRLGEQAAERLCAEDIQLSFSKKPRLQGSTAGGGEIC